MMLSDEMNLHIDTTQRELKKVVAFKQVHIQKQHHTYIPCQSPDVGSAGQDGGREHY